MHHWYPNVKNIIMYLEVKFRTGTDVRNCPMQSSDYIVGTTLVNQIASGNKASLQGNTKYEGNVSYMTGEFSFFLLKILLI